MTSVAGKPRHDDGVEREGRELVRNRCGGNDRAGTGINALTGALVEPVGRRVDRHLAIGCAVRGLDAADNAHRPEFEGVVILEADLEVDGLAGLRAHTIRVAQDASAVVEDH